MVKRARIRTNRLVSDETMRLAAVQVPGQVGAIRPLDVVNLVRGLRDSLVVNDIRFTHNGSVILDISLSDARFKAIYVMSGNGQWKLVNLSA